MTDSYKRLGGIYKKVLLIFSFVITLGISLWSIIPNAHHVETDAALLGLLCIYFIPIFMLYWLIVILLLESIKLIKFNLTQRKI
jgi:hypothetical protein